CELRVFDALDALGPLDADAVAERLSTSTRGTELLLDTCVGLGLLHGRRSRGRARYSNSELSSTFLASGGTQSQHHLLLYLAGTPYRCWGSLARAVRQGRNQYPEALGVPSHEPFAAIYRSEAERLRFMRGLQDMWRVCGRRVMAAFDLSPFRVICDVGGGSGALAKDCAALYPGSRVTVFDVPEVVSAAKTHFRFHREGLGAGPRTGDFFQDDLPEAELYILARILHDWSDGDCARLLARIHQACAPGGGVLVIESVLDEDGRGPVSTLLLSLNMLVQTEGQERTVTQYRALTASAGFPRFKWEKTGGVYDVMLARK
uniref:Acetylserotonin O-methyltransferase n=1 Tax=Nannospalax galili TaxID=1026970 RepID=A0A8C6W7B1_NANGA